MAASWKQLAIVPSAAALAELREHWGWLLSDQTEVFMASAMGDVFLEGEGSAIFWLDTGRGKLEMIAQSREGFMAELRAKADDWFLAFLVDELLEAGVVLDSDQCYGYKLLPVLGGKYEVSNVAPMSAGAWYGFSGYVHEQIKDLPDGAQVSLVWE